MLVLGGADSESYSLWTYDVRSGWAKPEPAGGATAVGRNATTVALGRAGGIAISPLQEFVAAEASDGPGWTPAPFAGTVVSVALSPSGRSAIVVLEGSTTTYMVQDVSGEFASLSPAPRQPFSPLVAWLDDNRIAALSVNDLLISHLCVIDPAAQKPRLLTGLTGVRVFAVSPGGSTIAAATEGAIYVGPASTWLANKPGAVAVAVPGQTVVWDLALDSSGTRLAFMSGQLSADGTVTDRRATAFEATPAGWQKMFEADLPFEVAGGQIWLS